MRCQVLGLNAILTGIPATANFNGALISILSLNISPQEKTSSSS